MSNNKKRSIAVVLILLAVSAGIIMFSKSIPQSDNSTSEGSNDSPTLDQAEHSSANISKPSTIASKWQWQEADQQETRTDSTNEQESLPFTPQSVHDALQAVKVDENGNIILDHDALISLDEALERIHKKLDSDALLKLQDIIESALPDKVGEQTSQLVEDYKGFLDAKDQFDQINQPTANASAEQTVASITSDQALYQELQDLRELHLGRNTADKLFQVSDANAEFMFESIKLGLDNNLSAEEITSRRKALEERHRQQLGSYAN